MPKSPNSDNIDKGSKDNQSHSDNPFIRFRHFADEHVSSILQGFIGLPSAFAKPQSHSQWSVFDEDLRRRDELQARRRELKEAEEAKSGKRTTSENDKVQIPVKESQTSHNQMDFDHLFPDRTMNIFSYDIPLYSPVHSPLAAPFPDNLRHTMSSFAAVMLYRADANDISLMPYLLCSPYSPLILSVGQSILAHHRTYDMQSRSIGRCGGTHGAAPRDDFPYREAFEDLLLTSQGRSRHIEVPSKHINSKASSEPGSISSTVESGLNWIERLRALGILHLRSSDLNNASNESRSFEEEKDASNQDSSPSIAWIKLLMKDAETEEQMYESFLTNASTTPDQFLTKVESTLTAVERLMKSKSISLEEPGGAAFSDAQGVHTSEKSISQPTEPKREVCSSSTVEHYTNEDGSVETTIRVWKRFDDGSETETTSSHTVDKATRLGDLASAGFHPIESKQREVETNDQDNKSRAKKNTKPGWFWN
ncbi:8184054e-05b2-4843-8a6b-4d0277a8b857 [Sclerotinia trifoliorum]|uniref:8184054e-05b2-4843-8a6b-4d0277a8b857 n=1 Tax=Sclerotinia trifoliorum TaxID=28548 RepID=A0A8H2W2U5_9HELO|nr:8184054e-05b2-4843-8a6b-4d0277a8b857 [Sclerotinia trifoliorum]